MKLDFLNELVSESSQIPGAVALILNHDTTVLASTSANVETKKLASDYYWFKGAVLNAVTKNNIIQTYQVDGV